MTSISVAFLIELALLLMIGISITSIFFKIRKRSVQSIYKLISDLEKKIYSLVNVMLFI